MTRTRLTRRGWLVVALVAGLLVSANSFGARSINAVVAPALVALAASLLEVHLLDRPDATRRAPDAGVAGDELPVELDVESDGTFGATVDDRVGDGLTADGLPTTTTVGGMPSRSRRRSEGPESSGRAPIRYDVTAWRRGERQIGPLEITASGPFGLARRTFYYNDIDTVLVYPRPFRLAPAGDELAALPAKRARRGTDEFDGLREYRRGDPLRDVHWKSSAKRPDDALNVRQYVSTGHRGELTVGVSPGESDDAVAAAAASVALYLLDAGFEVGLAAPDESLVADAGSAHRGAILASLARLRPGSLSEGATDRADVAVRAAGGGVFVDDGEESTPFDDLVETRDGERVRYDRPLDGADGASTPAGDEEVVA